MNLQRFPIAIRAGNLSFFAGWLATLLFLLPADAATQSITWDPKNSSYNGKAFVELQSGVGAPTLGYPGPTNPVGAGASANGTYAFGFATSMPGPSGPTMAQTDLSGSPLAAGTDLVLRFNKAETDHISFIGMVADASDLDNIGFKQLSSTQIEIRARIVDPVLSKDNDPDAIGAAFGLIMHTTSTPDEAFNFKGTVFVTDMHWLDLEVPDFTELPQGSDDVQGMAAAIAAKGISALGGAATFTAFMPEAFFQFARDHGVDVTGGDCLGYRAFVELTGSDDGFYKLNDPTDQPFSDSNFDIDGDGQPDEMWRFRIVNSTWSRQVLQFGLASAAASEPTPDFNGDGKVDFTDFIQFARQYPSKEGDGKFDSRFDLNGDREVSFNDFILFARSYGK